MTLRKLLDKRSRIAVILYLVGLAQFVAVVVGMELVRRARTPEPKEPIAGAEFIAERLAHEMNDPNTMERDLSWLAGADGGRIVVRDPAERVVSRTPEGPHPTSGPGMTVPMVKGGQRVGTMEFSLPPHPPPPKSAFFLSLSGLVVLVVGASSLFAARLVTTPLSHLTSVARAFGRGKLDARAKMTRSDELGELGRAFDDMADRIAYLLRAERDLLANVSHELRTPLARIRVALDLANDDPASLADPHLVAMSLREIAEDLAELERLVDDVLAAARLAREDGSAADFPLRRERLDMNGLLEMAVARFNGAHPHRHLAARIDAALPEVEGDAVLLRRVFDNLLDNAHKYSDKEGAGVVLEARREAGADARWSGALVIEVRDSGVGISKDDLPRLFEPFFRADRSRTRATGGLGLGLSLAKRVVEAHGGVITLESEVGRGTTARVTLPLRAG